jgi:hypothetical protein
MTLASLSNTFDTIVSLLSWLDWLGLATVLLLMGVLAFLIWRRKYAKDDFKLRKALDMTVPKKLELPPDCLSKVWRGFVNGIPWRLRPDALRKPLSLVIGDAGSGKTSIIDRYANWQGQDFLFHPSATNDPLLQIYLGAESLELEFGATLIYDTHPAAYRALKKLWRRLPTNPQAVMVIDATTLLTPQTELLRQSGHALFGKLKVFGKLEGRPLPLILALSHMEKVKGFVEFCVFLEEAGIPLQIEFPENNGVNKLGSCLDGYKQHLARALVTRPAQDYLKIVSFLNEAPRLFDVLVDFLRVSGLEQGVESPPVVRLCLLSEQVHSFGCHPFSIQPSIEKQPLITLNRHAKAALVLLLAGVFYLAGSYRYQQDLVSEVHKGIETVSREPVEHYSEKISPLLLDFSANLNKNALLSFMPIFFAKVDKLNKYLLIVQIRKYYLLPLLKQIQFESDAPFKTIRLLGILYATPTNELGKIISQHPEKNLIDMTKYGQLIQDYLLYNSHTGELDIPLNEINYAAYPPYIEDHTLWLELFRSFQQILKKPFIEESEFITLQQQLVPFFDVMDRLEYYNDQTEIKQWLLQYTNLHLQNEDQSELRQRGIIQLFDLVRNLKLNNADNCDNNISLMECLAQVQAVANAKPNISSSDIVINLDGEQFSFTPGQGAALMTRSRVSMMLRNLVYKHRNYDGWVFFSSPSIYNNVEMNSSNSGQMLFAGKARIDGRLTVDAFEQTVKPAVLGFFDIVTNLPIDGIQKKSFIDFVQKNLNTYSTNYVNAYLNYFQQFRVRIDSTWALNFVLDDLQQPNSQLLQILVQIKNNTALNLPPSPYFQSFAQKLTVFRYIQHLMEEKSGVYPEFQNYQVIMAQMQRELEASEPYQPKKPVDNTTALKGALTPFGRVALSILLEEDGSYMKLVKDWLQNTSIQKNWQQPFLAPVQKVKEFGTDQINQQVDGIWSDLWDSSAAPLLGKFPFSPSAGKDQELALDDLTKTFHPKLGVFWVTFNEYLSPLSSFSNGVWVKPYELTDNLKLPKNFLERLNAAQQLTSSLWDGQGNPKPLELYVKPGLLPTFDNRQIPHAPLVSLSYLRNGGVSVLGFNQQADWQKLPLEWWTGQPAVVGMEFRKIADDPTRVYTEINVDNSPWNFFRLLQKGHFTGDLRYRWLLAHPDFPQQPLNLEFSFQSNPLAAFANLAGK